MLYLLDTSALIAHYRQEAGWERVQAIFDDERAGVIIASVTLPEFARRLLDLGANSAKIWQTLGLTRCFFPTSWRWMRVWLWLLLRSATEHPIVCLWWTR